MALAVRLASAGKSVERPFRLPATLTSTPWRRIRLRSVALAGAAATGVGASLAIVQALDLRDKWKTHYRVQAGACEGPTDGVELRSSSSRPRTGAEEQPAAAEPCRPTLLLFLGDSLVSGVGGQAGDDPAPAALPSNVAARLAERGGGQVRWASVGITGADVERLRNEGVPRLREKIAACKASGAVVIVVLVVGVNDLRKLNLATYRLRLRALVDDLRYIVHADRAVDAVVLPALRIADAPMLQRFPLQYFVSPICALWEREKSKAVRWFREAAVLPFPRPPSQDHLAHLFSPDQMHPSASGYEWWADSLARQIHSLLLERR